MKLNLGCGADVKSGYVNVDFRKMPGVDHEEDLSKFPWSWADQSVEEILMFDFLEHFPYRQTDAVLNEAWRVLKPDGLVEIQVPDFEQLSNVITGRMPFYCNRCGFYFEAIGPIYTSCPECKTSRGDIVDAAVWRIFGGQDYEGNYHYTTFTPRVLRRHLLKAGFGPEGKMQLLEEEHQAKNWNFKMRAYKSEDQWKD